MEIIDGLEHFQLQNWYVGAGCINQSVWNKLSGYKIDNGIKDIDIIYFDKDLSYEAEDQIIQSIKNKFYHLKLEIDIKNQARVHLWYKDSFGNGIKPYLSSEEAINIWPTTATAIGITKSENQYKFYAPYGLDDILNMVIRPNKIQVTEDIYYKKVNRWVKIWEKLQVIDW